MSKNRNQDPLLVCDHETGCGTTIAIFRNSEVWGTLRRHLGRGLSIPQEAVTVAQISVKPFGCSGVMTAAAPPLPGHFPKGKSRASSSPGPDPAV